MRVIILSVAVVIVFLNFEEGVGFARKFEENGRGDENGGGDDDDKGEPVQTLPAEIDLSEISLSDNPFDPEVAKLLIKSEESSSVDPNKDAESEFPVDENEDGDAGNWEDYDDEGEDDYMESSSETPKDEIENSENENEDQINEESEDKYDDEDDEDEW